MPGGAYDQQNAIEARSDVLCYTTPPLESDVEVTGPLTVTLFAATTAADTDFTAKLVDVEPCGAARSLVDGIIRARYRQGTDVSRPIHAGSRRGVHHRPGSHQQRLSRRDTASDWKSAAATSRAFDRNFNTAGDPWAATESVPALQTIHHDEQYPSRIRLPIIPV